MSTDQTPAQKTADLLAAVANHLRQHPHLPTVSVERDASIQIAPHLADGWPAGDAIIAWARSLPGVTITAKRYTNGSSTGRDVPIHLTATLNGIQIRLWDAFDAGDDLGLEPGASRELSFEELHDALASAKAVDRG